MVALLTDRSRPRKMPTWLPVSSVAGALIFTAGWLIAGRVQDNYNPRSDYISSLAAVDAANPWVVILALVTFGIGVMSLGAGLVHKLQDPLGRVGSLGILLSGLCVLVVGLMRHDCGLQLPACSLKVNMGEISGYHAVHDVAAAATVMVAGASQLLIAGSVRRREGWHYLRLPSMVSGSLTLLLFALMSSGLLPEWVGAIQRVMAVVACIWVSTFGVHLYRLHVRDHGPARVRRETALSASLRSPPAADLSPGTPHPDPATPSHRLP